MERKALSAAVAAAVGGDDEIWNIKQVADYIGVSAKHLRNSLSDPARRHLVPPGRFKRPGSCLSLWPARIVRAWRAAAEAEPVRPHPAGPGRPVGSTTTALRERRERERAVAAEVMG